MRKAILFILGLVVMVAIIVGLDVTFFPGATNFWERLVVNVGIVLVFVALYIRFIS